MKPLYEEYDKIYTQKWYYRCPWNESPFGKLLEKVAEHIKDTDTVVELGCGTGQLMELLLEKGIPKYIGYDFSQVGIDLAREKTGQHDVEIFCRDLYELEFLPFADVYIAVEVFEHLKDDCDKKLLSFIPQGKKVVITVPNFLGGSHVRMFATKEDILNRYDEIKFDEITELGSETKKFICIGEKK